MRDAAIHDIGAPRAPQTFAGEHDRARLTGSAVKAVLRLIDAWGASNAEGTALLGVSPSTWDRMKAGTWEGTLSQDQLTRASALIGLFKGLHLLFANDLADRWPRLVNTAPVFDRRTPVHAMIEGGIPQMLETGSISTRCVAGSETHGAPPVATLATTREAFARTVPIAFEGANASATFAGLAFARSSHAHDWQFADLCAASY